MPEFPTRKRFWFYDYHTKPGVDYTFDLGRLRLGLAEFYPIRI